MKFRKVIIGVFFLIPSIGSSQILIDSSLLNHSDKWKPKISLNVIANVLKKVSLGPIETVHINKGEKNVSRSNSRSFEMENEAWGIVKYYHIEKSQPFDITSIYNETDSIFLNMKMVTKSEGQTTGILHSKKQLPESGSSYIYCQETTIKTNKDTTQWFLNRDTVNVWKYHEMCSIPPNFLTPSTNVKIWRMFSSRGDTVSIYFVKGFGKKVYRMSLAEGFVFIHNDKQIAAYQFLPRYMWIRKDLKEQDKRILGGAVISILSDYHNGYY